MALEQEGCEVVFANDHAEVKRSLYAANFDASHYVLSAVHTMRSCGCESDAISATKEPTPWP